MEIISSDHFHAPASPPSLQDADIHVWLLVTDDAPDHRAVATAAHALLGRLLARYAGLDRAPVIARTGRGKPHAPALAGIDFNLSHARDHVLIAVARNQPLGVDLERVDRRIEIVDLARRYFARAEADALEALPEAARPAAFLRLWTCKEAVLKAIGEGLSFGLDRVAFTLGAGGMPNGPVALATEGGGPQDEWRVALLEPADGFLGALAWRGPPRHVRTFLAPADV